MRALLAHPLRRLIGRVAASALAVGVLAATPLPRPIGPLSDYGAVLDRHGRERVEARIAETQDRLGIEVHILASWENPLPDAAALARALLDAWGLAGQPAAILAVFVRSGDGWTHAIAATDEPARSVAPTLEDGLAELVAHNRIEEAIDRLFDLVAARFQSVDERQEERDAPAAWPAALAVALVAAALVWGIRRWICPRCGHRLRAERERSLGGRPGGRVYFCRSCGYRRRDRTPPAAER